MSKEAIGGVGEGAAKPSGDMVSSFYDQSF